MLNRVIDEARAVPQRVTLQGRQATHRALVRIHHSRLDGQERLWSIQVRALEQAEDILGKSPRVVGLRFLRGAAVKVVERALDSAKALPAGYEGLNAKDAIKVVRDLELVPLLRVRHWEAANKARKTVLAAVDKRMAQLDRVPEPVWDEAAAEAGEE